ncbi:hypothetical protein C0Q70_13300 [Pomacea canaliculata]|uniref:RNA helicase n=1 Tax=Pomacea canaliculata TaxID=400727 RepID=A0A2T7NWU2_POMCA|nr:hypothetical protein C0Q70_13300 [Pomacea canaliculata]
MSAEPARGLRFKDLIYQQPLEKPSIAFRKISPTRAGLHCQGSQHQLRREPPMAVIRKSKFKGFNFSGHASGKTTKTNGVATELPRITIPVKMQKQLIKLRERKQHKQHQSKKPSFKSPLVISCKRSNYNHHRGQTYSDFGPSTLASYGWKNRKAAGDYMTIMCHDKNPALLSEESEITFTDLKLDDDIKKAVLALGYQKPTAIQQAALSSILSGTHTLCAAETGSGKTLAYLLPALDMLLRRKRCDIMTQTENSPSVIILAPSRELADQITGVARSLQEHLDFVPYSVCGGRGTKGRLAWPVRKPMDILISTPGVLRKFLIAGHIKRSALQQIILDEADTLLDDSFIGTLDSILQRLRVQAQTGIDPVTTDNKEKSSPFVSGVQFVLVSATMPRDLQNSIGTYLPVDSIKKVTTAGLNRLMPHVPQKFLRVLPSRKPEIILKLAKQQIERSMPSMIFCNDSPTSFFLKHLLEENGITSAIINGKMQEKVQHVINYDFPLFVSDYIHRAGRVGRVGAKHNGQVTSLVSHSWEVDVLWQIEIAARKVSEIHNVNANIKRKVEADFSRRHGKPSDII